MHPIGIELPVEHATVTEIIQPNTGSVTVDGELFYNKYNKVYTPSTLELHLGKSLKIIFNRKNIHSLNNDMTSVNIRLENDGTLTEQIHNLKFIIKALSRGKFEISGTDIFMKDETGSSIQRFKDISRKYKTIKQLFKKLDVSDELILSEITDEDEKNIQILIATVLNNKPIKLPAEVVKLKKFHPYYNIGNLKIRVTFTKIKDDIFNIINFNDNPCNSSEIKWNDTVYKSCPATNLEKDDFLQYNNINYTKLLHMIESTDSSEPYSLQITQFLYTLLLAHDESSSSDNDDIINAAIKLATHLKNNPYIPKEISTINYLQAIKRKRKLNIEERNILEQMINNNQLGEDLLIGAYLLLGLQEKAQSCFNNLTNEIQNNIRKHPIFFFWNEKQNNK